MVERSYSDHKVPVSIPESAVDISITLEQDTEPQIAPTEQVASPSQVYECVSMYIGEFKTCCVKVL